MRGNPKKEGTRGRGGRGRNNARNIQPRPQPPQYSQQSSMHSYNYNNMYMMQPTSQQMVQRTYAQSLPYIQQSPMPNVYEITGLPPPPPPPLLRSPNQVYTRTQNHPYLSSTSPMPNLTRGTYPVTEPMNNRQPKQSLQTSSSLPSLQDIHKIMPPSSSLQHMSSLGTLSHQPSDPNLSEYNRSPFQSPPPSANLSVNTTTQALSSLLPPSPLISNLSQEPTPSSPITPLISALSITCAESQPPSPLPTPSIPPTSAIPPTPSIPPTSAIPPTPLTSPATSPEVIDSIPLLPSTSLITPSPPTPLLRPQVPLTSSSIATNIIRETLARITEHHQPYVSKKKKACAKNNTSKSKKQKLGTCQEIPAVTSTREQPTREQPTREQPKLNDSPVNHDADVPSSMSPAQPDGVAISQTRFENTNLKQTPTRIPEVRTEVIPLYDSFPDIENSASALLEDPSSSQEDDIMDELIIESQNLTQEVLQSKLNRIQNTVNKSADSLGPLSFLFLDKASDICPSAVKRPPKSLILKENFVSQGILHSENKTAYVYNCLSSTSKSAESSPNNTEYVVLSKEDMVADLEDSFIKKITILQEINYKLTGDLKTKTEELTLLKPKSSSQEEYVEIEEVRKKYTELLKEKQDEINKLNSDIYAENIKSIKVLDDLSFYKFEYENLIKKNKVQENKLQELQVQLIVLKNKCHNLEHNDQEHQKLIARIAILKLTISRIQKENMERNNIEISPIIDETMVRNESIDVTVTEIKKENEDYIPLNTNNINELPKKISELVQIKIEMDYIQDMILYGETLMNSFFSSENIQNLPDTTNDQNLTENTNDDEGELIFISSIKKLIKISDNLINLNKTLKIDLNNEKKGVKSHKNDILNHKKEEEKKEATIKELKKTIAIKEGELVETRKALQNNLETNENLTSQLKSTSKVYDNAVKTIEDLRAQSKIVKEKHQDVINDLKNEVNRLQEQVKNDKDNFDKAINDQMDKIKDLETMVKQEKDKLIKKEDELESKVKSLNDKIKNLEDELNKKEDELKLTVKLLNDIETKTSIDITSLKSQLKKSKKNMSTAIKAKEVEISNIELKLKNCVQEKNKAIDDKKESIKKLKSKYKEEKDNALEKKESEIKELKSNLEKMNKDYESNLKLMKEANTKRVTKLEKLNRSLYLKFSLFNQELTAVYETKYKREQILEKFMGNVVSLHSVINKKHNNN